MAEPGGPGGSSLFASPEASSSPGAVGASSWLGPPGGPRLVGGCRGVEGGRRRCSAPPSSGAAWLVGRGAKPADPSSAAGSSASTGCSVPALGVTSPAAVGGKGEGTSHVGGDAAASPLDSAEPFPASPDPAGGSRLGSAGGSAGPRGAVGLSPPWGHGAAASVGCSTEGPDGWKKVTAFLCLSSEPSPGAPLLSPVSPRSCGAVSGPSATSGAGGSGGRGGTEPPSSWERASPEKSSVASAGGRGESPRVLGTWG